jgi:hypothetical protein
VIHEQESVTLIGSKSGGFFSSFSNGHVQHNQLRTDRLHRRLWLCVMELLLTLSFSLCC